MNAQIDKDYHFNGPPDDLNEDLMNISYDEAEIDDIFQCGQKKSRRKIFLL